MSIQAMDPARYRLSLTVAAALLLSVACSRGLPPPRPDIVLPDRVTIPEEMLDERLFTTRLTEENFAARRVDGPQAVAGVGDWVVGNGLICAVVSDVPHEAFFTTNGGQLVDLGHCDLDDEQWTAIQMQLRNMRPNLAIQVDEIESRTENGRASIVTRGQGSGIKAETTYWVDRLYPRVLRVDTRYERVGKGDRLYMISDTMVHGDRSLAPFVMSTRTPSISVGFEHPEADPFSISSVIRAMHTGDFHVLVGSEEEGPGIAYGLLYEEAKLITRGGDERALSGMALNGEHFTLQGFFIRPLWLGGWDNVGWLQFMQTPFMNLREGEAVEINRLIVVGDQADVASVTDQFHRDAPLVTGEIDDPRSLIHVVRDVGVLHREHPFTVVRPRRDGRFSFRAPHGDYEISVRAAGGRVAERSFEIDGEGVDLGIIEMGAYATLRVGSVLPVRLVFVGAEGTPDPRFGDDHLEFHVGGDWFPNSVSTNTVNLAGTETVATELVIAPGRYRVLATRGPEFEISETSLTIGVGESIDLAFTMPERVFETPGWLSADLHVHSSPSFDTTMPSAEQVRAFTAMGGEVIVSTEHDFVVDYGPLIEDLGLQPYIRSVIGTEATSTVYTEIAPHTLGHANVFPIEVQHSQYRQGALAAEERRLREVIAGLRALPQDPLIQINHPRALYGGGGSLDEGSYFTHLGAEGQRYRPERPLDASPNRVLVEPDPVTGLRDLDFDAIEMMSGPSRLGYRRTRADWLSLLLQGEYRAATASSDSHSSRNPVGLPRTYVRVANGTVDEFTESEFISALRSGYAVGTTGPWIEVDLDGAGPGDQLSASTAVLRVRVEAAPWVPVSELRVRVNGWLVHEEPTRSGMTHQRLLHFDRDSFVFVEVEGDPSDDYQRILPGAVPLAFANPIFVDADGDGEWTPPGLPKNAPDVLTDPDDTR